MIAKRKKDHTPQLPEPLLQRLFESLNARKKCKCRPKVMCIDDEYFNMLPLEHYFKTLNADYLLLTRGEDAVNAYKASLNKPCCKVGYPLIITDIQMTEMNGYELAKNILELERQEKNMPHPL